MGNKTAILFAFLFGIGCGFAAFGAVAQVPGATKDNGTDQDGNVIIPPMMAMRCGLTSRDMGDESKIRDCFDKIKADSEGSQLYKQDIGTTRSEMMHGVNKAYFELATKYKYNAVNFEEIGDANGNSDLKTDKHGKKEQEGKVTAGNAKNLVGTLDVYSSMVALDAYEAFFDNLSYREVEGDPNEEEKSAEPATPAAEDEGGKNE